MYFLIMSRFEISRSPARVALVSGLLPIIVVNGCYIVSVVGGYLPRCFPYLQGCTSVSSAGRYGAAYFLFKAGMIPLALLLAYFWVLVRHWLIALGDRQNRELQALVYIGLLGAAFLILYTAFLGTKGDIYSLLRRFGVTVYFSCSYLAQLLLLHRLVTLRDAGKIQLPRSITGGMLTIAIVLLFLGLISIPIGNFIFIDEKKIVMNVIEWNFALLLSGHYLLAWQAWLRVVPVRNVAANA
jgi:hypothetical protein